MNSESTHIKEVNGEKEEFMATLMLIPQVEEGRQVCSNGMNTIFKITIQSICWHRNATSDSIAKQFAASLSIYLFSMQKCLLWNRLDDIRAHIV